MLTSRCFVEPSPAWARGLLLLAWLLLTFAPAARAQEAPAPAPDEASEAHDALEPAPQALEDPSATSAADEAASPGLAPSEAAAEDAIAVPAPRAPVPQAAVPAASRVEPDLGSASGTGGFSAVAIVPLPGRALSAERMPRTVLRVDRALLESTYALGVHDALNARGSSVVLQDVQNNPLQVDLQYRGFTASPLLGSPQGLAVYQGGVRIHDPLGDVVQWDLMPQHAIDQVEVVAGANPLYGQNALGGGIVLRMKDGFSAPGYRVVGSAGAFERLRASVEHGHVWDDWAVYASAATFGEEGFRDESRSTAQHGYFDLRTRTEDYEVGMNLTLASTDLNGNGLSPIELLRADRRAVFTYPDNTQNDFLMLAVDAKRRLLDRVWLSGNVYARRLSRRTLNGDEGDFDACMSGGVTLLCNDDDELLETETGGSIEVPMRLGLFDGVFNTTDTASLSYGGSVQVSVERDLLGHPNQLIVGSSLDQARSAFLQRVELGHLTPARGVSGQGIFLGGEDFRTKLDVESRFVGLYAVDTLTPLEALTVQVSARLNYTQIELIDREGTALDGEHEFLRVNPGLGVTLRPWPEVSVFANYAEGSRAPSAVELACADPEAPCRLPNAFVADPPLDQVVTRSVELGVRGEHGRTRLGSMSRPRVEWAAAGFLSRNLDDIIFVAGSQLGTGYFLNAGQTQRAGLELSVAINSPTVDAYAAYTLLRATFETPLLLPAAPNPGLEIDDDEEVAEVPVQPGDRMPGLPTHSFKAGVTVRPWSPLALGAFAVAQSDRPYRGDEANLLEGVPGHAVVHAFASYQLLPPLRVFIKVENVFDAQYETFGLLAEPDEVLDNASDPRFLGPAAPLAAWLGVELRGT